jgi:photosystem II stability/assembly factor-like uncharacterized protein
MKFYFLWLCFMFPFVTVVNGQWMQMNGPHNNEINALAVSGNNVFAGTNRGIYLTNDSGKKWSPINIGLPATGVRVFSLAVSGTNIYAGTEHWAYLSTNNGTSWKSIDSGLIGNNVVALAVSGTNLFASTDAGTFLSKNNGANWIQIHSGFNYFFSFHEVGQSTYATTDSGIFLSTNHGLNWVLVNSSLIENDAIESLGTYLFASTRYYGVFLSTDNGKNWDSINKGLPVQANGYRNIYALEVNGVNMYASTDSGVYLSIDSGASWNAVNSGMSSNSVVQNFAVSGMNIYAGTYKGGVYLSSNNNTIWKQINTGFKVLTDVTSFASLGADLYAGADAGIFISSDSGYNWQPVNWGLSDQGTQSFITALEFDDTTLFAGTAYNGILRSNNRGLKWTKVNNGLTAFQIKALLSNGENIFAGTNNGIFISTNNGENWKSIKTGLKDTIVYSLFIDTSTLYAGTSGGIYLSKDNGLNWTKVATTNTVNAFAKIGNNLFAGTGHGLLMSRDQGSNWSIINTSGPFVNIRCLVVYDTILFASDYLGPVYSITGNGANWQQLSTPNMSVFVEPYTLKIIWPYLIAGSDGDGVWRRPLSDLGINAVNSFYKEEESISVYPNPAESSISIESSIDLSHAQLNIFDQLGRSILHYDALDFTKENKVTLDVSGLPTGIYFLRIEAKGFSQSQKVMIDH